MTRRGMLALLGASALGTAGVGALAGCTGRTGAPQPAPPGSATPAGQLRQFVSRPDLRPCTVTVRTRSPRAAPGLLFVDSHAGPGQQGPMILDGNGDLVWFKPLSEHGTPSLRAFNLRVQRYRGAPVLTWFEGRVVDGHGQGEYVLADTGYREIARVRAGNGYHGDLHEFVITDRDTAVFTCYGKAAGRLGADTVNYYYGVVQEVDVASGAVLFQWRSDDHVRPAESYTPAPKGTGTMDYFHINSINVDGDGNLLVSARNTWCVYKVDRSSGAVLWRMGGKHSDFRVPRQARFAWQHHVTPHRDGTVTVFDNEASPAEAPASRALVLRVDEPRRTVSLAAQYHHDPPVLASALGSVQVLPGGHLLVGWGTEPYITEYEPDGTVVFDAKLAGSGTLDYRAFRHPWSARPPGAPALQLQGAGAVAYASWNGATDIARWRLLTGDDATTLRAAGAFPKAGFETGIRVPGGSRHVAVEALDGAGKVLGRSPARTVG